MMEKIYTCFTYGKPLIRNSRSPIREMVKRAYHNNIYTANDQRMRQRIIFNKQKSNSEIELYKSWIVNKKLGLNTPIPPIKIRRKCPMLFKDYYLGMSDSKNQIKDDNEEREYKNSNSDLRASDSRYNTPSVKIPFELEITRFNSLPSLNCIEYEPEPSNGENYCFCMDKGKKDEKLQHLENFLKEMKIPEIENYIIKQK